MKMDIKIVFFYRNNAGDRQQRTFRLSEIRRGEDAEHLKLLPGYELIGIEADNAA